MLVWQKLIDMLDLVHTWSLCIQAFGAGNIPPKKRLKKEKAF